MRRWLVVVVAVCACRSKAETQDPTYPVDPPMCSGQTAEARATPKTPRDGAMTKQLSPGFVDQMSACPDRATRPQPDLAMPTAGAVDGRGDCQWSNGVVCHVHLGAEFLDSRAATRPNVGEVHCIFPTSTPKSPRAFVTHFTCKPGTDVPRSHEVRAQEPCGTNLLPTLAATMEHCDARCCERGTLTDPAEERKKAGTLDERPDFSVCTATAELDCDMFANMVGHPANAPKFGEPIDNGI
jgi:hypothetical protein